MEIDLSLHWKLIYDQDYLEKHDKLHPVYIQNAPFHSEIQSNSVV